LTKSDFTGTSIVGSQLNRVQADGIRLSSAKIIQSCIEESNLSDSDLTNAVISSSDFNGASFRNANLSHSQFINSRLSFVSFDGADLTMTDLRTALELEENQLFNTKLKSAARLPTPIFKKSKLTICKET